MAIRADRPARRYGNWKLIEWFEEGRELELYNLKADIGENNNLAAKVKEMHSLLKNWRSAVGARMPSKNPASISN
jgi:hypothetical protein